VFQVKTVFWSQVKKDQPYILFYKLSDAQIQDQDDFAAWSQHFNLFDFKSFDEKSLEPPLPSVQASLPLPVTLPALPTSIPGSPPHPPFPTSFSPSSQLQSSSQNRQPLSESLDHLRDDSDSEDESGIHLCF
jgi:hypothetical protein